MPRHKYLGNIVPRSGCDGYVETQMTFADFGSSLKAKYIEKPPMQGPEEVERTKSMIDEYLEDPRKFKCKNKIVFADLHGNWFIIDGQHRLSMIEQLYSVHKKYEDSHKFILCWYKVSTTGELEDLFFSLNKDSKKNYYYIKEDKIERIRITSFMELFSRHFKIHFCKKKSNAPTSRIYAVEEIREKLIALGFFKIYNDSCEDLFEFIKDKNNKFYDICRYEVEMNTNPDTFYKDEEKKIQSKFIMSLKNNNFLEWIMDPDNNTPIHRRKIKKKKIPQKLRKEVWVTEFKTKTVCKCPIPHCKNELHMKNGGFHAGHLISEVNGGEVKLSNLRPICSSCNIDMGTTNWNDYESQFK